MRFLRKSAQQLAIRLTLGILVAGSVIYVGRAGEEVRTNSPSAEFTTNTPPDLNANSGKLFGRSFEELRKQAENGDAAAMAELGERYRNGVQGSPTDFGEAVKWYQKAALRGDAKSQYALGVCYQRGEGVLQDDKEAVAWYRKAAAQGYAVAQYALGFCYYFGTGVSRDFGEAVAQYREAAEQGFSAAQYALGVCHHKGEGVLQDDKEAVAWYRKAAAQGYAVAQYALGVCSYFGTGVPQDYREAVAWYRQAAELGNTAAQYNLGLCYFKGSGTPQDYVEAYRWANLAAAQGEREYIRVRDGLARVMTPEQIAEGQRRASQLGSRNDQSLGDDLILPAKSAGLPRASGTGFFITEEGYLVTIQHVVKGSARIRLVTAQGVHNAKIITVDPETDLALLKAEGTFAALPVAPSRGVKLGETVATVGFPNIGVQGFSPKQAKGEIASLAGIQDDPRHFQISVPIQPGNSGGPLVDQRGNVVGIVVGKLSQKAALAASGQLAENVSYAVKSSLLLSLLDSQPEVLAQLRQPNVRDQKYEDVISAVERATVLVLVY